MFSWKKGECSGGWVMIVETKGLIALQSAPKLLSLNAARCVSTFSLTKTWEAELFVWKVSAQKSTSNSSALGKMSSTLFLSRVESGSYWTLTCRSPALFRKVIPDTKSKITKLKFRSVSNALTKRIVAGNFRHVSLQEVIKDHRY